MAYDFEDVPGPDGRANAAGLAMNLLVAPLSLFTLVAAPGTYTVAGDEVKIVADHTFGASDGFTKLRFVPDSHGLNATMPEGRDSSGYMPVVEGAIVAASEEIMAEVLRNHATTDVIVLVPTANGKYIQLGTEHFPAQVRQTGDSTGTAVEGESKQAVKIISNQPKKLYYEGTITYKS